MTAVSLGGKALADFDQPLDMLKDCHRRIEHFLEVLGKVDEQCGGGELTEDGRRALQAALDYFANFAPRHTSDEEQSLFPRLRSHTDPEARDVLAELDRLEGDHRRGEAGHAQIDELGRRWLDAGRLNQVERTRFQEALAALQTLYADHIRFEEQRVFAVAAQVLPAEQLQAIGQEMKRRRSVTQVRLEGAGQAATRGS